VFFRRRGHNFIEVSMSLYVCACLPCPISNRRSRVFPPGRILLDELHAALKLYVIRGEEGGEYFSSACDRLEKKMVKQKMIPENTNDNRLAKRLARYIGHTPKKSLWLLKII